jgi:hypothetical protein
MLTTIILMAWLSMLVVPDAPLGRFCRRWLVEAPARRLATLRRKTVVIGFALIITCVVAGLIGQDAQQIVMFGTPDVAIMLSSIELGTMLDIAAATLIALPMMRPTTIRRWLASRRTTRRRGRIASQRRVRARPAANDDSDPAGEWRRAA